MAPGDASGEASSSLSDPFISNPSRPPHLRYSVFDSVLFAPGSGTSADQVKRALEAHLADIQRRMEEAGKLGSSLVRQQKELTERLKEVTQLDVEGDLTPDLRQRLLDIEKQYNEVAKESARAFLPKQRIPSNETSASSPFAPEGKSGKRSVSPSKFESQATASPTKLSVPNRKFRNQPANRIHDIEFAAEISSSLITQVRNLQQLLAEREQELKEAKTENSRLEVEAEGFHQRMKTLDESEHRYKDENWNLETQIHELTTAQKESAEREEKLAQAFNILQSERNKTQRELDEVRLNLSRLDEQYAATVKQHDIELGTAKRKEVMAESEKAAMQHKIDDLMGQNQELAKAFSMQRGRILEQEAAFGMSDEDHESGQENVTPEHSPPPSPVKGTPRHSVLESETLKTSLHHAQRALQSLRTNVHREKTEKLELKRMLQEARDELERIRGDLSSSRRSRKTDSREFKKPPRLAQLGSARSSKSEIYLDDPNWEDQTEAGSTRSPAAPSPASHFSGGIHPIVESGTEHFETANDTSDAAFETAQEGTETDFHTGVEEFSDDDEATETEATPSKGFGKIKRPPVLPLDQASNRYSFQSTASTSNDEEDYGFASELKTPITHSQSMRHRLSRTTLNRRPRVPSEEPVLQSSPASIATGSAGGTPQPPAQSLFAELGDLEGSDDDSSGGFTPSRKVPRPLTPVSTRGWPAPPAPLAPPLPKATMVSSGMMTEPIDIRHVSEFPDFASPGSAPVAIVRPAMVDTGVMTDEVPPVLSPRSFFVPHERPMSMESVVGPARSDASAHWLGEDWRDGEQSRPLSTFSYSDAGAQFDPDMETKLAQFPSPPTSPLKLGQMPTPILAPPQSLSVSRIQAEHIEPHVEAGSCPTALPQLRISSMVSEQVEPLPEVLVPTPVLVLSSILSQHVEPTMNPTLPTLSLSSILVSQDVEPIPFAEHHAVPRAALSISEIRAEELEPLVEEPLDRTPLVLPLVPADLTLSSIRVEFVEPQHESEVQAESPAKLSFSVLQTQEVEPIQGPAPPASALSISAVLSQGIEPVSPEEPPVASPLLAISTIQSLSCEPLEDPFVVPQTLSFAPIQSVGCEPVELRNPKRDMFVIPQNKDAARQSGVEPPQTPTKSLFGSGIVHGKGKGKVRASESPVIAEDETRHSLNSTPITETPESQRPLKELSRNTDMRPPRKQAVATRDQSVQTFLTCHAIDEITDAIDDLLKAKSSSHKALNQARKASMGSNDSPATVRRLGSQGSLDSADPRFIDYGFGASALEGDGPYRSATVGPPPRQSPPPPPSHVHAVEGARLESAGGGQGAIGSMGPPLLPASAYRNRNATFRPRTPTSPKPQSPTHRSSQPGTPTPRAGRMAEILLPLKVPQPSIKSPLSSFVSEIDTRFSAQNAKGFSANGLGSRMAGVPSPTRATRPSTKSSVSSFASEIDSRFNIHNDMGFGSAGFGSQTDSRMIQAITQTMLGEYLWKYTRKPGGRGEMSEKRHRRYFWVNPYARTLYWGDRDPSTAGGRTETKAKSVPIEAVRVVTDDNPMPPGLHRKSIIIIAPGRSVKFTCTTGQRHETWFNALSYLMCRTGDDGQADAEEIAGNIAREDVEEFNPSAIMAGNYTREDVEEFNPPFNRRPADGTRARPPPSLSSYNSRMTRTESAAMLMSGAIPTLSRSPQKRIARNRPAFGTLGRRISGYLKESKVLSANFSVRSRSAASGHDDSVHGASEAYESAEDVRITIEKQDRESDKLENVRACCDGKHDVGTLGQSSRKA